MALVKKKILGKILIKISLTKNQDLVKIGTSFAYSFLKDFLDLTLILKDILKAS